MKNWADWELRYLRAHWPAMSDEEIGEKLGRSPTAVRTARYKHGVRINPDEWSAEDDDYIREHWKDQTDEETGAALGRDPHAVYQRGVSLGLFRRTSPSKGKRNWSEEEHEYLRESWGHMTVGGIAKHLNRSVNAVMVRANRLGLGPYLDSGEYVTLNQLMQAVTGNHVYSYTLKSWVDKRGMPVHYQRVQQKRVRVVYIEEFWEWAEKNRSFIDFSKMEPLALGMEPDWVQEQRRKDFAAFAIQRKDPWTPDEDSRLKMLLKQHRYGYMELSEMLHRSAGAIQRRCTDLGLKERPVRASNRGDEWTDEDFRILADGIRHGDSYTVIGNMIGKSEKAIRGKVYFVYLTERADKVRALMGDGEWGDGAPEPNVGQAAWLSRTRTQVRKDLSMLDAILRKRMNDLGYDPFWQRFMCQNWDDIGGCAAGCSNCDECTEFVRIKPQYCARCGGTFYERKQNRFCAPCRTARKKHAQRHWVRTYAKGVVK